MDGVWDETVDNHEIIGNMITNNGQCGIHIYEGRNCQIKDNVINENGYGFLRYTAGIWLHQSTSNIIENNTIHGNRIGLNIVQSHENIIRKNEIDSSEVTGIKLKQTSNNKILNNVIHDNKIGILLHMVSQCRIGYNDIYLNSMFGMISIFSTGNAANNWWGNSVVGPFLRMIRIVPPFAPIVIPWSPTRIND